MNILLIDADSTIPNLPLMKLSSYHKRLGDNIELLRLNIPYYPNRKKVLYIVPDNYDKIYCSVIFKGNSQYIRGDNIIFGGTGVDYSINLPREVEYTDCDYSIYPDNDTSYGFITRGCIRNCKFCIVPEKEGGICFNSSIKDIIKHKKVKFLDNNILAYSKHKEILQELIDLKVKHTFYQGLDIRLLDKENSFLLSRLNYWNEYIFAFDDWRLKNIIEKKLELLDWRKSDQIKFFVYIHPDMPFSDTLNRIKFLRARECLPYIMRDIGCWKSPYSYFYTDIASWCNQPGLFKHMEFEEFMVKRYPKNFERIKNTLNIYRDNL